MILSALWCSLFAAGVLMGWAELAFPASKGGSVKAAPGVALGELRCGPGGRCLVCRRLLDGERVECRSCRTPQHRACWDYVGSCSLYGCGARSCNSRDDGP